MNFIFIITYFILGLLSFLILSVFRSKYKINKLYNGIFSIILMVIYASIFSSFGNSSLNENIFISVIFLFICDFIYATYIQEVDFFNRNDGNTLYYLILMFISYFINSTYINKVDEVFLSGEDIRIILWTLFIIFIYKFIRDEKIFDKSYSTSKVMDEGSILTSFTKLRRIYLNDIKVDDLHMELALYSIMIYRNKERNAFSRKLDNFFFKIDSRKRKLGIMQIESTKFISDVESIDIVYKDLKKLMGKKTSTGSVSAVLSKYVGEDNLEVIEIYNTLKNFFKI